MKKILLAAIITALTAISLLAWDSYKQPAKHSCNDITHINCDGLCECDGLGCEHSPLFPVIQDSYKDQFSKLRKISPLWDSLAIDRAIKED